MKKIILKKEELENALVYNGLSRSKLARKCDISEGHMSRVLNGKFNITPASAKKISDALNTPMTELFEFKN